MISGGNASCFPIPSQALQMYPNISEDFVSSSSIEISTFGSEDDHSNSLLSNFSLLKDKVHQLQSLVSFLISSDPRQQQQQPAGSTSISIATMETTIQEIMFTASSMMFTCHQMAKDSNPASDNPLRGTDQETGVSQSNMDASGVGNVGLERGQSFVMHETFDGYGGNCDNNICNDANEDRGINVISNNTMLGRREFLSQGGDHNIIDEALEGKSPKNNYDIVELDVADLLAKYTHYCQVCGKGFKRDANLRMHMRAHGDEYKTSAALSNPTKRNVDGSAKTGDTRKCPMKLLRKYSCPQEGCRWNQRHVKFQPLKSMICVKNHYKRSHCPKMFVCKRCNKKQFSVVSDLRTHEKHCGDLRWQCSCGTTFSRKDKLMGHVALFVGHTPMNSLSMAANVENQGNANANR